MEKRRDYTLDMLKVFATICIVFHHYQQDGQGITGRTMHTLVNFYGGTFSFGYMVELFFLISGICMFPYIQKIAQGLTFYRFYTRRAARLLPLMAISGVVSALLLVQYQRTYSGNGYDLGNPSLFGIVIQALGVQSGWAFENPFLNNPTWYCSVLLLCYLVFYAVVYWSARAKVSPYYGITFFLLLGCAIYTYEMDLPFLNSSTGRGFSSFFGGILLAAVMPHIKTWRYSGAASLGILLLFVVDCWWENGEMPYFPFLLTFVFYPALIVFLQNSPARLFAQRPFWGRWVKITYSIFIWHFPAYLLLFLLPPLFGMDPGALVQQTAMLLFACLMQPVGWLSYRFVEKPLNRKLLGWFSAVDPQPEN